MAEAISQDSDGGLMRRVASKDSVAFEALVARYHADVLEFLSRRLAVRSGEAEDLAQAVFLHVWRDAQAFRGRSSVSTYLKGIALNLCRQERAQPQPAQLDVESDLAQPVDICTHCGRQCSLSPVEADACRRERELQLARAVADLPKQAREAIRLHVLEGRSAVETAVLMGGGLRSVRRHVAEGLAILREKLD